jgi:hypothetical protein
MIEMGANCKKKIRRRKIFSDFFPAPAGLQVRAFAASLEGDANGRKYLQGK